MTRDRGPGNSPPRRCRLGLPSWPRTRPAARRSPGPALRRSQPSAGRASSHLSRTAPGGPKSWHRVPGRGAAEATEVFARHPAANDLAFQGLPPEKVRLRAAGGHEVNDPLTVTVGPFLRLSGEGGTTPLLRFRTAEQFSSLCRAPGSTGLTKCCTKPASCERRRSSSCP